MNTGSSNVLCNSPVAARFRTRYQSNSCTGVTSATVRLHQTLLRFIMNPSPTSYASKRCFEMCRRVNSSLGAASPWRVVNQGYSIPTNSSIRGFHLPRIQQKMHPVLRIDKQMYSTSNTENLPDSPEKNNLDPVGADALPVEMKGNLPVVESNDPELKDEENVPSDDFLTTIFDNKEPYIDTYAVFRQLVDAGFTASQSDEIINLLIFQLNSKLTKLSTKYSHLYELENERYLFESAHQELNVDITRNREQHITDAINQINALERDYGIISDDLNNHFIQMKNDIQVAINDQKSDNTLMSKKIMLRMQESNHKITTELNMAMRSEIESLRWHLSRWGLITICVTIFSGSGAFYIYRANTQKKSAQKDEFVPLVIYEPSEFDEDDYHADLDPNAI